MPTACTNIGYIVKDYVKPIIQALTVELKHYHMRLLTTKCLNTSVTFWHLLFGKRGHEDTMYCDVMNVVERHEQKKTDNNVKVIAALKENILAKNDAVNHAYYIMLTDGYFVDDDKDRKEFFPGHVFVIEKVPTKHNPYFYIYQSYINEYDFKGSLEFRVRPQILSSTMEMYIDCLEGFAQNPIWDEVMVAFWKDLTNVDTSKMLGCRPENAFHMCFRKKPITECLQNMERFVDHILETIPAGKDTETYGRANTMYNTGQEPHTNHEIRNQFLELKRIISQD